jgi:hypothetical protein
MLIFCKRDDFLKVSAGRAIPAINHLTHIAAIASPSAAFFLEDCRMTSYATDATIFIFHALNRAMHLS